MSDDFESVIRRVAYIMGESSASYRAISEAERQRALGLYVEIVRYGDTLLVISRRPHK